LSATYPTTFADIHRNKTTLLQVFSLRIVCSPAFLVRRLARKGTVMMMQLDPQSRWQSWMKMHALDIRPVHERGPSTAGCTRLEFSDWRHAVTDALRYLRREDPKWKYVQVRSSQYLNNLIEQDHRAVKRRCASMGGFKSFRIAAITLAGIELAQGSARDNSRSDAIDIGMAGR
jgi:hypothetical protein